MVMENIESKERVFIVVVVCFTIILLAGFWVIPNDMLAQASGVLGVCLPAFVKLYQAFRKLQPRFDMELEDVGNVVITLPRNIQRIRLKVKNAKSLTIEGAGDEIILAPRDAKEVEDVAS